MAVLMLQDHLKDKKNNRQYLYQREVTSTLDTNMPVLGNSEKMDGDG